MTDLDTEMAALTGKLARNLILAVPTRPGAAVAGGSVGDRLNCGPNQCKLS